MMMMMMVLKGTLTTGDEMRPRLMVNVDDSMLRNEGRTSEYV